MRNRIIQVLLLSSVAVIFIFGVNSDNGKAGATGSPGEVNCTNCHSGTVNSGSGSITISCPDLVNWEYTPGQMYTCTLTVAEGTKPLFGFGFEALLSSGANAGTLTQGTGSTIKTANISGNVRRNVVHQLNSGASAGSHAWTFTWTAPATNVGNVTFYCGAVAANANGSDTGDKVYTISQVVTPAAATAITENASQNWNIQLTNNRQDILIGGPMSGKQGKWDVKIFNLSGQEVYQTSFVAQDSNAIIHPAVELRGLQVVCVYENGQLVAKKKIWN
ncbi:MAG: hypothetical protein RLY35_1705 [Bacteroidota bacterium]|jgi:hypothetical protein